MSRKRKEVRSKTVLTKNGRIDIHVYVRENLKKGGRDYFSAVFDSKADPVVDVTTQEYRAANSSFLEAEVIDRVIARTIEKYEAKGYRVPTKVDYVALVSAIPEDDFLPYLPASWTHKTLHHAKKYFLNNSAAVIQGILDAPCPTVELLASAQDAMLKIVEGHQPKKATTTNTEDSSEQQARAEEKRKSASAQKTANRRIAEANIIYQISRVLLPQENLPLIQIPRMIPDKYVPIERCNALPRVDLVTLAALFLADIERTALSVGGLLMECDMLRPSEACAPKFSNIVDFGAYGVYAVRRKVDSETVEVVDALKNAAAHRTIVIPAIGMEAIRRRKAHLLQSGLTADEVNNAYVVSCDDDPSSPANPQALSHYIKTKMDSVICDDGFWPLISLLMSHEPDVDEYGFVLADPTAYSLRRATCSNLMNCAAAPKLSGENIPLFVLVDILMGHRLSAQDAKWKTWANREDNWGLIAQVLESIVLDPDHSAHPAFASIDTELYPDKICHSCQRLYVPEGVTQCTINIHAHSSDAIFVRLPQHGKNVSHEQIVLDKGRSSMPIIQEEIDRAFFERGINLAKEMIQKERSGKNEKESEPV